VFARIRALSDRLQNYAPPRASRYLLALGGAVSIFALFEITRTVFGPRSPANIISFFVFLVILLGSAWLGYGPGLLATVLTTLVLPQFIRTNPPTTFTAEVRGFAFLGALCLVVSFIADTRRKREGELRRTAEELERRVQLRTEEAHRAADAVREQAELLDLAHDAIVAIDWDGTVRFWNQGAANLYHWPAAEANGQNIHQLLNTEFSQPLEHIRQTVASAGHWEGELIHTRRDGAKLHVASRWAVRRDSLGTPRGYLEINTDITEKRRIDENLRHTQRLESLGVLAGGVAHDFNNLLTGILGNASLVVDSMAPHQPNRMLLEEIMKAAERAADLTRQLLAYAGKGRFVMRIVDLSELVREIAGLVRSSVPKHVQLRLQLYERLPGINADPGQLQQVIMNLVINGAEAIPLDGGTVLLRTEVIDIDDQYIRTLSSDGEALSPGPYVTLEVHDTGSGMDEATQAKIFDPFFTTKFAGRGLGLSAVLGIVRAHHGALKVYSKPGQGTTFKVLIPASARPVEAPTPPTKTNFAGTGKVLVVDDEEIVRQAARNTLVRYGYTPVTASDGPSALDLYREDPASVALVLLDLTMPRMNGEKVLQQLQAINPQVRVLLTSGYNEVEAVQRFAGKGLSGFIQKPFTASSLAEKVKEVLTAKPLENGS
jgi:PAS domain S-box-containing protein